MVVSKAIFAQRGISVTFYPLDPMPVSDLGAWFYQHQAWHQEINRILGVQGVDLTDVDFKNSGEAASFIRLHGNEHLLWSQRLGTPA